MLRRITPWSVIVNIFLGHYTSSGCDIPLLYCDLADGFLDRGSRKLTTRDAVYLLAQTLDFGFAFN